MTRRIFLLLCLAALSVFAQMGDSLLAIVGEEVITMSSVLSMTAAEERSLAQAYSGEELQERIAKLRRTTLDGLINHELFYLEFKSLKAQLPMGYLQERINQIIMERAHGNVELFEEQLLKEGVTMSEFREKVAKNLAVELLVRDRLTRGNIVSEEDVKRFFYRNQEKFARPFRYRLSIIQLRKDGRYAGKFQETFGEIMHKLAQGIP
ncbi:MAG: SurA N-terminal domain-containing protein, partial [Victivallales bacterium]|nr:SurA N-terminal domain-containing protein [Victivallales bacterium]